MTTSMTRRGFTAGLAAVLSTLGLRRAAPAATRMNSTSLPRDVVYPAPCTQDKLIETLRGRYEEWEREPVCGRTVQWLFYQLSPILLLQWHGLLGDRVLRDHELAARRDGKPLSLLQSTQFGSNMYHYGPPVASAEPVPLEPSCFGAPVFQIALGNSYLTFSNPHIDLARRTCQSAKITMGDSTVRLCSWEIKQGAPAERVGIALAILLHDLADVARARAPLVGEVVLHLSQVEHVFYISLAAPALEAEPDKSVGTPGVFRVGS